MNLPHWWNPLSDRARRSDPGARVVAEIEYLSRLDVKDSVARDEAVVAAAAMLRDREAKSGAVDVETCARVEELLTDFTEIARSVTLHVVGHAHMDMNWMWGFDETVGIVVETIRTMLRLLDEYPMFRFSQSQGAVYEVVERFSPDMIEEIRPYVRDDRWELVATQWTEADMNLPNAESLLRQTAESVRYLSELFDQPRDAFRIAFMPDTFGHSAATPEIFCEAGIRYVYHGRGSTGPFLSRWYAESGRSVLAYQDPRWYNESVRPDLIGHAAEIANEYRIRDVLSVYGVGDHGGGPTRRDIERLAAMQRWPVAPTIRFSTYHDFFRAIESVPSIPHTHGERNPIFTGCYSSQARIKAGNLRAQRALFNAELAGTFAGTLGPNGLSSAWRTLLFNQFHDILPGSGVAATREHALAGYQELSARAQTEETRALRAIARRLQTSAAATAARLAREIETAESADSALSLDTAEGAGVGFGVRRGDPAVTGRWGGPVRPYLVVNTLEYSVDRLIEITVWDWDGNDLEVLDERGSPLPSQTLQAGTDSYWSHRYARLVVRLSLTAWQFRTLFVRPKPVTLLPRPYHPHGVEDWLVERPQSLVLENRLVRVALDPQTLVIRSMRYSEGGREILAAGGAGLRLEYEEAGPMTSWLTHRTRSSLALGAGATIRDVRTDPGAIRQWIEMDLPFSTHGLDPENGGSTARLRLELDAGSPLLRIRLNVSFRETTTRSAGVPRLAFAVSPASGVERVLRDVPVGFVRTAPDRLPIAAQSFAAAETADVDAVVIGSRDSQSFVASPDTLSAVLLRGSRDPDPTPEVGEHEFELYLGAFGRADAGKVARQIRTCVMDTRVLPIERPRGEPRGPEAPLTGELASIETHGARVLAVTPAAVPDSGTGLLVRLAADPPGGESSDTHATARIAPPITPREARLVNAIETDVASETNDETTVRIEEDGSVHVQMRVGRIASVFIGYAD